MNNDQAFQDFLLLLHEEVGEMKLHRELPILDAFTDYMIAILNEAGELEEGYTCYHKARGVEVNGYGLEEDGTLNLFRSTYTGDIPASHLGKILQFTADELQGITSGSQLLHQGVDHGPTRICLLGATQLKKIIKFLQELCHSYSNSKCHALSTKAHVSDIQIQFFDSHLTSKESFIYGKSSFPHL